MDLLDEVVLLVLPDTLSRSVRATVGIIVVRSPPALIVPLGIAAHATLHHLRYTACGAVAVAAVAPAAEGCEATRRAAKVCGGGNNHDALAAAWRMVHARGAICRLAPGDHSPPRKPPPPPPPPPPAAA